MALSLFEDRAAGVSMLNVTLVRWDEAVEWAEKVTVWKMFEALREGQCPPVCLLCGEQMESGRLPISNHSQSSPFGWQRLHQPRVTSLQVLCIVGSCIYHLR